MVLRSTSSGRAGAAGQRRWGVAAAVPFAATLFTGILVAVTLPSLRQPFWFDEQWRAYDVSAGAGWWSTIAHSRAPMSAGWYVVEKLGIWWGGNTELALRLANLAWLPVLGYSTFALARRLLGAVWGAAAAAAVMVNGVILGYAIQFKPFVADAAGTVTTVAALTWLLQKDAGDRRRWWGIAAASAGLLVATPAVFAAGPLLVLLLWTWWRGGRQDRLLLAGPLVAGFVGLAHLSLFVLRQNSLSASNYWNPYFPPHSAGGLLAFVVNKTAGFFPHFVSGDAGPTVGSTYRLGLPGPLSILLGVLLVLLLCLGGWQAWESAAGRVLLVAIVFSFPVTLLAAWLRLWPYGFVRTNFYEIPLLYLVAVLGLRKAAALFGAINSEVAAAVVAGLAIFPALVAGWVTIGTIGPATSPAQGRYGGAIEQAVAQVRVHADASTVVVVAGDMAYEGWHYYMYFRRNEPSSEIPASQSIFVVDHGDSAVGRFVSARPATRTTYYYVPVGATGAEVAADKAVLRNVGFCTAQAWTIPVSGLLIRMTRC